MRGLKSTTTILSRQNGKVIRLDEPEDLPDFIRIRHFGEEVIEYSKMLGISVFFF
jgi:hypothetical protein